jgi:hypothetical protein
VDVQLRAYPIRLGWPAIFLRGSFLRIPKISKRSGNAENDPRAERERGEADRWCAGGRQSVYQGIPFTFGSPEHHALIQRAIWAKLEQNPEIVGAFVATHPGPIIHDTGWPEHENTSFPAAAFTRILTELRRQLLAVR